jgi:hypothetical protein
MSHLVRHPRHWLVTLFVIVLTLSGLSISGGLAPLQVAKAGACPGTPELGGPAGVTLDECVTSTHFTVFYTTHDAVAGNNLDSESEAQLLADNLEFAWDRYVNDPDFAFRIPLNTDVEPLEVWVYDIAYLGVTSSSWNHLEVDASFVSQSDTSESQRLQNEATPLHELFHRVQYKYDKSDEGNWAVEGQAKFMEDEVFADLDNVAGTQYQIRSNGYLANPNWDVTTASYNASLFWKYFSERYGAATDEPERGVDAIRRFWEAGEAPGVSNEASVNGALDLLGHPSVTFEDVFSDWIAANYTKDLATLPDPKYGYLDDDGGNVYSSVPKTINTSIDAGDYTTSANQSVVAWGAKYYRVTPTAACGAINFDFSLDSGAPVYHVLTIKDGALVDDWTSTSNDWSKTVINDDYDEVVAVVGGNGAATQVDVSYGCVDLSLNIVVPTTTDPAFVGSILDPGKFLVRLEVTSPQNIKIEGLNAQDFDISVGAASADIILGAYVQSQYWLLVQAPTQSLAGDYDLTAAYGAASDSETAAVRYLTIISDNMLVIDRSGSMTTNDKIGAAKNAARLYTDATEDNNMLGLVSFNGDLTEPNEDATLDYDLTTVNSTVRSDIKTAINGLVASGFTSIGDGLYMALGRLDALGDPAHTCAMTLLSDGMENEARFWADIQTDVVDSDCVVDTVALGPDTDEVLLQEIASLTGGSYYYVPDENFLARGPNQLSGDWRNELSSTYEFIQGDLQGRSRLFEVNDEASYGNPMTYTVTIEDDLTEALFFVSFSGPTRTSFMQLFKPDGKQISCQEQGVRCVFDLNYNLIHVAYPTLVPGDWTMVIVSYIEPQAPQQGVPFLAGVSGNSHTNLQVFLGAPLLSRVQGVQMPVLASLAGRMPILGANVMATIIGPTGLEHMLMLYDDGQHGDGAADDGLYGNLFTLANQIDPADPGGLQGSYRVKVNTDGVPGMVTPRFSQTSFAIELDADSDGDGMPDMWEDSQGLNKLDPGDASQDPDLDDLDNLGEYNAGTDPFNSDTDGGGENDGSEVDLFLQDPLNPADDQIPAIQWVAASPNISATVLTFDVNPDYNRFKLYRSLDADTGYLAVQNNVDPTGVYTDTGLTNETTYFYKMMAIDGDGHRSAVSLAQSATPREDPFPPTHGSVLINDGATNTYLRDVMLHFFFEEPAVEQDVSEVLISNDPGFAGAEWQPYTETMPWTLASDLMSGDMATVYVKFRDAAMNESPDVAGDSIELLYQTVYLPLTLKGP